jgi:hypothetical protein
MQAESTEKKLNSQDFIAAIISGGTKPGDIENEPEKRSSNADFIAAMAEAGEIHGINFKHNEQDYEELSQEKKVELCSRRSGNFGIRKLVNGQVERVPRYCNHCEDCYKANALKLKGKVEVIDAMIQEEMPDGQWRKKIVEPDTEAQSLKKHIKRNQGGRHIEIACTDNPGKAEVWCYVQDEPGRNMDEIYGETSDLEEIDFDALYRENRRSGKKMSTGGAFRKPSGVKKEDTIRVVIPEILIKDSARQDEAEEIMRRTNFIEEADTPEVANKLYIYQFRLILQELKKANIEITAIKASFFNMTKEDLLNDWNGNVRYWLMLSGDGPLLKNNEDNLDITDHLIFPKTTEKGQPIVN